MLRSAVFPNNYVMFSVAEWNERMMGMMGISGMMGMMGMSGMMGISGMME